MTDHLVGSETDATNDSAADDASTSDGAATDHHAMARESDDDAAPATSDDAGSAWARWRERRSNRVSKWDRPPDPKDWRYFVGTLGKVLIATGILMFGFVAYQLWGTGIETARAQSSLENSFEAAIAANQEADDAAPVTIPATDPSGTGTDTNTDTNTDTDTDTETESGTDTDNEATDDVTEPSVGVGGRAPSDVVPGGVDLSDEAVVQNVPIVPGGDALAKLEIPRIGLDVVVVPGVTLDDLKKGPGHYPDTPLPGQLGNASIAGHRTTYGAPFFDVDQLQAGDEIIVTMITGDQFVYSVTGSQVVTAADSWVIGTRDPNVAELTLTTCHPKYTARDRLIIHSVLVPERSAQVGQAEFWDAGAREVVLEDDSAEGDLADRPAGDDPTFDSGDDSSGDDAAGAKTSADDTTGIEVEAGESTDAIFLDGNDPSTADDAATDDAATDDAATDDAADDTTTEAGTDTADAVDDTAATADPDDAEIDAFSEGWFHDRDAWPQIALWGSVLTIISLLAYQLSKKTRHDSIGLMVGVLPFLLALYFFFQNINRLLPPGL